MVVLFIRRISGATRRSSKGGWTEEEVSIRLFSDHLCYLYICYNALYFTLSCNFVCSFC